MKLETRQIRDAVAQQVTGPAVFYSFRRCPYAMRARLALAASGQAVLLREVALRDKPDAMLKASPKGTVPVLVLPNGTVLEESLDIMAWALGNNDPEGWRAHPLETLRAMDALVVRVDGPFKQALDRYKYTTRYRGADRAVERAKASAIVDELEVLLDGRAYLFGDRFSSADAAILPFIRQFAFTDIEWFRAQDWPRVQAWLDAFVSGERFKAVMTKYAPWQPGDAPVVFGGSDG